MSLTSLYIISGPSGSGKTSLIKALLGITDKLSLSISYTTRARRESEQNGVHYHFVQTHHFEEMIRNKHFLEYAKVFGCYYGTSLDWVKKQLSCGVDVLIEVDWQGARKIKCAYPDAIGIFILPPSLASLRERLCHRGEDKLDSIQNRLQQACLEISHYALYDYLVVNAELGPTLKDLEAIIRAHRLRTSCQIGKVQSLLANTISI